MTKLYIVLSCLLLMLAVGMIAYPLVSNYTAEKYASQIRTEYYAAVAELDDGRLDAERQKAQEYNALLAGGVAQTFSDAQLESASADYSSLLNVNGDGIMAYIDIPLLDIRLPVYHGTEAETLEDGIGHVVGSSLPVGGESTHAVISGHSGMASQKMFSDLDKLQKGDAFYLHTLNKTLAYEVDQIKTVLPTDTSPLAIEDGKDYVTLITCTPFGVNTHRLLVRGVRVPYEEVTNADYEQITEQAEPVKSTWMEEYKRGLATGGIILAWAGGIYFGVRKMRKRRGSHEKTD